MSGKLKAPLAAIFRDEQRTETVHSLATDILAKYAEDDPSLLAELLMDSDPKSYASLFPVVEQQAARVIPVFQAELARGRAAGRDRGGLGASQGRAGRAAGAGGSGLDPAGACR